MKEDELCTDGAGQPGAGVGQHGVPVDPVGVPRVSGPHHAPHQAVCQGPPRLLRLLPPPPPLPHLQVPHVGGEEPGHGAGGQTSQVSLQIPPHGMYRVVLFSTKRGT